MLQFSQQFVKASIKETLELHMTSPSDGHLPVPGEFPTQKASNMENVSISWWTAIYTFDIYRFDVSIFTP